VLPSASGFGTWREEAQANEASFIKICNDIPVAYAATIAVNPCSAYRMLRDFETLKPGDVIIQNGANSMVGLSVIQMAKEMGVKTINIVRFDRPDVESELRLLTNLGGDINITDEYVNTHGFNQIMKDLPPCKLALNCVGGDVATQMSRVLGPNATMVTYGGMSKKPVQVPFEVLVYKQLKLKGFWITAWNKGHSIEERQIMLNDVSEMIRSKKLQLFYELHDFDDFNHALKKSMESFRRRKVVLNMDYPDRLKEHDEKKNSDYDVFETSTV
jgi:trans-2-enoyl-CoA reductase